MKSRLQMRLRKKTLIELSLAIRFVRIVLREVADSPMRSRTGAVKHSGLVDKFALAAVVGRACVRPRT